jgi:hypothetical protein
MTESAICEKCELNNCAIMAGFVTEFPLSIISFGVVLLEFKFPASFVSFHSFLESCLFSKISCAK